MPTSEEIKHLFAEFPEDAISWRAQSVTKDAPHKALALAYIDARDVMDRLDDICGAAEWQDRYEFHGTRTICYLSIRIDGEWITKADGAGDSDVEAEKGAISDALKRAAVKWGIGRYLYSLKSPWVPCEVSDWNGKKQWKKWTADPWDFVKRPTDRTSNSLRKEVDARGDTLFAQMRQEISECKTTLKLDILYKVWVAKARKDNWSPEWKETLMAEFSEAKKKLLTSMTSEELADVPLKDALRASVAEKPNSYVDNFIP